MLTCCLIWKKAGPGILLLTGLIFRMPKTRPNQRYLPYLKSVKQVWQNPSSWISRNPVTIMQGYLPVSDLSELLANISTDIREDGILNSQTLGSILINNAKTIKLEPKV